MKKYSFLFKELAVNTIIIVCSILIILAGVGILIGYAFIFRYCWNLHPVPLAWVTVILLASFVYGLVLTVIDNFPLDTTPSGTVDLTTCDQEPTPEQMDTPAQP